MLHTKKEIMKRFFALFTLLLTAIIGVFAGDIADTVGTVLGFDLNAVFLTYTAFAGFAAVLAGLLNNWLKTEGFIKQVVAWVTAIALVSVGWLLNFGFLAEVSYWLALLYGFAAGLAANGFYDIPVVKTILGTSTE